MVSGKPEHPRRAGARALPDELGPFSVDPSQVTGLGGAMFQQLVSRLLAAELAAAKMTEVALRTTHKENIGDEGVDALVEAAAATRWIPAGDSAWQFKAGDLSPKKCADELDGATFAHEVLRAGGTYRLVLGKALTPNLVNSRQKELRAKAKALGFDATGQRFRVIDGNQLAAWVERYPALAVSKLLRGPGTFAIAFDAWTQKIKHRYHWVPSAEREELRTSILDFLHQANQHELRIEGESGLGKSRSVLEALRGSPYEQLAAYVGDASDLRSADIDHLIRQDRSAVLVVDECGRERHKAFAEQLEIGSAVRLVTIGHRDATMPQPQTLGLPPLPSEAIEKVLDNDFATLGAEARRIVVTTADGNVGWAIYLAAAVRDAAATNALDMINAAGLSEFILSKVASDGDFLAISALALLTRYGFEGEKAPELEILGNGLDISVERLVTANRRLAELGLLTKHGRYRSVSPHPLAVLLASRGWEHFGERIIDDLLPALDASMAERLFLRAADLGSGGAPALALDRLLGTDGPFRSLDVIARDGNSRQLIQLAIIAPQAIATHLRTLIGNASDAELRAGKSIRRDLVWALEKIVWHSSTFEDGAELLLRLAMAENETFSNNASGTWQSLFSAMLPATAASPTARIDYLRRTASDPSTPRRQIAVAAAKQALDLRSTAMVSGELQGGVVVERRGMPATWGDVWNYQREAIRILGDLSTDTVASVREAAVMALVGSIHPMLEAAEVRGTLFDVLTNLPSQALRKVRTEIHHLNALFDRVETPEFRELAPPVEDVEPRRSALRELADRLPAPQPTEELQALADAQRWEWEDGELQHRIAAVAVSLPPIEATECLASLLETTPPPHASFELGAALHAVSPGADALKTLSRIASGTNVEGLVGYLHAQRDHGDDGAFDAFLDGDIASVLPAAVRLAVTVRGPKSAAGWDRALALQNSLPVREAALGIFGWHIDVEPNRILALLNSWLPRIETQADYNACVDLTAMLVFRHPDLPADVEGRITGLVNLRQRFGDVGQQSHDWTQLASRSLETNAEGLLETMLTQIAEGSLTVYEHGQEQPLLRSAMAAVGAPSIGQIIDLVEAGSWQLQMNLRGWFDRAYQAKDLIASVADDVRHARTLASLIGVGTGPPSEIVQFLLTNFGKDDQVTSSLYGEFVSGSWTGPESNRLRGQLNQLDEWISDPALSAGVKAWARMVSSALQRRLEVVLVEEAEYGR